MVIVARDKLPFHVKDIDYYMISFSFYNNIWGKQHFLMSNGEWRKSFWVGYPTLLNCFEWDNFLP